MAVTDVLGNKERLSKAIPVSYRQGCSFCGDSKPTHAGGHGVITFSNRFILDNRPSPRHFLHSTHHLADPFSRSLSQGLPGDRKH